MKKIAGDEFFRLRGLVMAKIEKEGHKPADIVRYLEAEGTKLGEIRKTIQPNFSRRFGEERKQPINSIDGDSARKILAYLEIDDFFNQNKQSVPISGKVGAGDKVEGWVDDLSESTYPETIDLLGKDEYLGVIVKGDSMEPAFREGDAIIFSKVTGVPESMLNQVCIVKQYREDGTGPVYVKKIKRSQKVASRYDLISFNDASPDIKNVEVEWVGRIELIKPAL